MFKAEISGTGLAAPGFDGLGYALLRARFRHESIEWFSLQQQWTYGLIAHIKSHVPQGLDKLRDSVQFDADAANHPEKSVAGEHVANVVVNDPAARFVEYGTPEMAARPFVRPGIEDTKRDFEAFMAHQGRRIALKLFMKLLTIGIFG